MSGRGAPGARGGAIPPWLYCIASMLSVQLSSALAMGLIEQTGAFGAAWLRLAVGAIILVALARPSYRATRRGDLPLLIGLGVVTGVMTMAFLAAIERIPLGTAVAIEFLGPLTVAALRAGSRRALIWPAVALAGVLLLTEPWAGAADPLGVLFAAAAAAGWGLYVLLTQPVGDRYDGLTGLAITVPIGAIAMAPFGLPQALPHLSWELLGASAAVALLMPVIPLALEMAALRRMNHTAFGTLMSLEPAIGLTLGALLLAQAPGALQLVGIGLVVLAGAAAQRGGRRGPGAAPIADEPDAPDREAGPDAEAPAPAGAR